MDFITARTWTYIRPGKPTYLGCISVVPSKLYLPGTDQFHHMVEVIGDQTRPGADCGYVDFVTARSWTTIGLDMLQWW